MEKWFEDLKSEVAKFLATATKDEIMASIEKAGYSFYKDIDYPVLDISEYISLWNFVNN